MKIGVMTPTYNRPDCIRSLVLQMVNQLRQPDVLCIHHNGNKKSYEWAIKDIFTNFKIIWLHNPEVIDQNLWYSVPLDKLIREGCTHFLWCDHDDFYYSDHIQSVVETLNKNNVDFTISSIVDVLLLKKLDFIHNPNVNFTSHDPGGMSSTMGFNHTFACELLKDLLNNSKTHQYSYSDQVVSRITMPKFKCFKTNKITASYVASATTVSSSEWVK